MHILLMEFHLLLPGCHSLKQKRSVLKRLLHDVRGEFNVSISEVGAHDHWQESELAAVCIGKMKPALERIERRLSDVFETHADAQLVGYRREWL